MKALVSVIVPVYNTAQYLDCCLQSAVGQSYRNMEIILVDDGSTDNSPELCRAWAEQDARIRCFSVPHGGAGQARNFGLANAAGEYVIFLDSDDWWDGDLVEKSVSALEKYAAVDFVFFDLTVHWENSVRTAKSPVLLDIPCSVREEPLLLIANISCSIQLWKNSFLQRIDFSFPSFVLEDIIVFPWLLLAAKKIYSVQNSGYHYRKGVETSTSYGNRHDVQFTGPVRAAIALLKEKNLFLQHNDIKEAGYLFGLNLPKTNARIFCLSEK
jgi:glycosyltransferase involved in cell wall biosynthesis